MTYDYDFVMVRKALAEACSFPDVCKKHPISALIESADKKKVLLGWNGAPTGIEHKECARKSYASGEGMNLCPTIHAERRAVSHASINGIGKGATIYLSEWFPCSDCAKSIIEAGIKRLVTPDEFYSDISKHILIPKLQNQSYNFEMADSLLRKANVELIVDKRIRR